MITDITIRNFKGWRNEKQIAMGPLTLFFGDAGTGKSTLGQFLTLLKQTVNTSDKSVVLYPGDPDSPLRLGTFSSLVHKHDRTQGLEFSYRFQLPEYLEIVDTVDRTRDGRPLQYKIAENVTFKCNIEFNTSNHPFVRHLEYKLYDQQTQTMSIAATRSEMTINTRGSREKSVIQYAISTTDYQLKNRTGRPWLQQQPQHFYGFSEEVQSYYKNLNFIDNLHATHESLLHNIYYVGSNRSNLNRLHVWSGLHRFDVGKDGMHTITALLGAQHRNISLGQRKRNQSFIKTIESILQRLNLLQEFNIVTIDSIDHGFEIQIRSNNKATLEFSEGGNALTQILPILVQCFCAPPNSIVVLDAPETHLHPMAQYVLAETLVDVIQSREDSEDRNIQVVVSTQSEYLLKGLQDQILAGHVPADDVQTYHTSVGRKYAHVNAVSLVKDRTATNLTEYFEIATDIEVVEEFPTASQRVLERPDAEKWNIKITPASRKKRGRPKGSKNKPKTTEPTTVTPKRGRGRPKGSKNKPKAPVIEEKRGPGRPKGSKNKPKS